MTSDGDVWLVTIGTATLCPSPHHGGGTSDAAVDDVVRFVPCLCHDHATRTLSTTRP